MSKRILCKFYAHGACLKGEHCEYAHDWTAPANNICTFYQRGACAYGSRCRYDHVKVSRGQPSGSSSSTGSVGPTISRPTATTGVTISGMAPVTSAQADLSPSRRQFLPPAIAAWGEQSGNEDTVEDEVVEGIRSDKPADQVICSFAAAGDCPRGEKCPHIHGDLCPTCGKHCLHPFRQKEREEHSRTCEKMQKNLEALKRSQEIECSVCLEKVLSKPTAGERKFGLLSECDHPFCITCIRNWRSSSPTTGMDVNSTLRACPICRKLSYYVIPSVIWYFSNEEKNQIVENYKAKLKSIDCKYFDFGNGSCPFGSSCFYKHMVKPQSLLRRWGLNPNVYGYSRLLGSDDNNDCEDEHFDAAHALFKYLFRPHKGIKEEVRSAIDEMKLLQYLENLHKKYSGDYDEEDLTPWERSFMWSQLGYDTSDIDEMEFLQYLEELDKEDTGDYVDEDFLTPSERFLMCSQLGYDTSDDDY